MTGAVDLLTQLIFMETGASVSVPCFSSAKCFFGEVFLQTEYWAQESSPELGKPQNIQFLYQLKEFKNSSL